MWWYRRFRCEKELVGECEAFLAGHYAERLRRRSLPVPGWAWTNLLAHGTEEDLRADGSGRPDSLGRRWLAARSYLSAEVLNAVERGGPLEDLQREALHPLELDLAARGCYDPRYWAKTVSASLASAGHHGRDRHGDPTLADAGHDPAPPRRPGDRRW